jgi:hypothetical protein
VIAQRRFPGNTGRVASALPEPVDGVFAAPRWQRPRERRELRRCLAEATGNGFAAGRADTGLAEAVRLQVGVSCATTSQARRSSASVRRRRPIACESGCVGSTPATARAESRLAGGRWSASAAPPTSRPISRASWCRPSCAGPIGSSTRWVPSRPLQSACMRRIPTILARSSRRRSGPPGRRGSPRRDRGRTAVPGRAARLRGGGGRSRSRPRSSGSSRTLRPGGACRAGASGL